MWGYSSSLESESVLFCLFLVWDNAAFEYDRIKKLRISNVKIEFYDADEKFVDTQLKMDRFIMNDANFNDGYDESYIPNANQKNMSLDDYDDDE